MSEEMPPAAPVPPLPPPPPAAGGGGRGWGVRETVSRELRPWDAPEQPPSAEPPPSVSPPLGSEPLSRTPMGAHASGSGFPSTRQLVALAVAAALVVAGLGVYLLRPHPAPGAAPAATLRGGAVAVVHNGPAVLSSQSLTGGGAGRSLTVPGSPDTIVTTRDGSKAFLLDTEHGQVIPVDLVRGSVGAAIPAGKLPVDEQLSADGATLFVTDNLGGAVIPIDIATGRPRPAQALAQGVASFAQAPDGSTAVVSAYGGAGQPGIIATYSAASGIGQPIEVGRNTPLEVFFSPDSGTAYVTERGVGNEPGVVIPVDLRLRAVGAAITVGHRPEGSALSPDGHTLVVTNTVDRTVTIVDLVRGAAVATVPVGAGPQRVDISADGATAWVACVLDHSLVPVDLQAHRAGAALSLSNAPSDLSLTSGAVSAWVLFPSSAGNVAFLRPDNSFAGRLAVGNAPTLLIAHDSATAWVANALSNTVQHIDTAANAVGAPVSVLGTPNELALTPDGHTLLVLSLGDGIKPGYLSAVDTGSGRGRGSVPVGTAPASLTLAPDGSTAYIANPQSNSVSTVDVRAWRAGPSISLPCSPTQLVVTPDGATLYVDCGGSSQVLPVGTLDRVVGAPIAVGDSSTLVMGNQGKVLLVKANHLLQEIDVPTNKVVLNKTETGNIISIVPTPDDATLVAAENTGGAVLLLHTATLATTTSISVGGRPGALELTPDGSRAYVLDSSAQKLFIVDVVGAKLTATVDAAPNAAGVVVAARQ